jgi:LytS/YehU family sensor histidine kinase
MLADEVKHLENYIAMNQLRFDDQLQVRFELDGSLSYRVIMPLLLITFVENCFKHGELFDPAHPLVIRLGVSNDELFFYTHNKKATGTRPKSSGIGLVNIKRRLDLVYPGQYTLRLKDEPHSYTCILTLNL